LWKYTEWVLLRSCMNCSCFTTSNCLWNQSPLTLLAAIMLSILVCVPVISAELSTLQPHIPVKQHAGVSAVAIIYITWKWRWLIWSLSCTRIPKVSTALCQWGLAPPMGNLQAGGEEKFHVVGYWLSFAITETCLCLFPVHGPYIFMTTLTAWQLDDCSFRAKVDSFLNFLFKWWTFIEVVWKSSKS